MKFYNISDVPGFFKAIDKCQGDVYLVTKDGDSLNLKSQITKYIAFSEYFKNASLDELDVRFTRTEDAKHMLDYIIYE